MPIRYAYKNLFPTQHEIADQLLLLLRRNGDPRAEMRCDRTYGPLADHFNLSQEARDLPRCEFYTDDPHNGPAWHNLVQWARRELKDAGYLAPSPRSIWRLSKSGIQAGDHVLNRLERNLARSSPAVPSPRNQASEPPAPHSATSTTNPS
jgi:hypothetical protein